MPILFALSRLLAQGIVVAVDEQTLRSVAASDRRAKRRAEEAHNALVDAIWEAADAGWPQTKIVAASGLTRERIRQLCSPEYRERASKRRQQPG
jgi:hypothetical protein